MPDDEKVKRFAELYVRYGQQLRAYFYAKGFDRDTAQDLTHDVFIAFLPISAGKDPIPKRRICGRSPGILLHR